VLDQAQVSVSQTFVVHLPGSRTHLAVPTTSDSTSVSSVCTGGSANGSADTPSTATTVLMRASKSLSLSLLLLLLLLLPPSCDRSKGVSVTSVTEHPAAARANSGATLSSSCTPAACGSC
jgi:hypothetical protein